MPTARRASRLQDVSRGQGSRRGCGGGRRCWCRHSLRIVLFSERSGPAVRVERKILRQFVPNLSSSREAIRELFVAVPASLSWSLIDREQTGQTAADIAAPGYGAEIVDETQDPHARQRLHDAEIRRRRSDAAARKRQSNQTLRAYELRVGLPECPLLSAAPDVLQLLLTDLFEVLRARLVFPFIAAIRTLRFQTGVGWRVRLSLPYLSRNALGGQTEHRRGEKRRRSERGGEGPRDRWRGMGGEREMGGVRRPTRWRRRASSGTPARAR